LGAISFDIILTPGHSPGSICLYHAESNTLISGDVLFQMSVGRSDLPGGNTNDLYQSITGKLFSLPDETKVYSGHGPVTTIGFEKMNNPFVR
jgi:glyoxylase-like metal-dependent hydrolase (beta-lactamase superfamily II)